MNFDFTADVTSMREKTNAILSSDGEMLAGRLESAETGELGGLVHAGFKRIATTGYFDAIWDEQHDRELVLATAEIEAAKHSVSFCLSLQATRIVLDAILQSGTDIMKKRTLDSAKAGDFIGALSMIEPQENSIVVTDCGDGSVILNGEMNSVLNGLICDWLLIWDVNNRQDAFLVHASERGIEFGPRTQTMGVHGCVFSGARMKEVHVRKEHHIQIDGENNCIGSSLDLCLATASAGMLARLFTEIREDAGKLQRRGKLKMADQHVRYKIAEILTQSQAAEYLLYRALWMRSSKNSEASVLAKTAKAFCAETAESAASAVLQLSGPFGYKANSIYERMARDAAFLSMAGTPTAEARTDIADALLARCQD